MTVRPPTCAIMRLIWSCMRPGSVLEFWVQARRPNAVNPTACRESTWLLRADSPFVNPKAWIGEVTGARQPLTTLDFTQSGSRARI